MTQATAPETVISIENLVTHYGDRKILDQVNLTIRQGEVLVIMSGSGFGLLGDIVIGIIGAVIGGFLFGLLGLAAVDLIGQIISATAGAVVLIYIIRLLKKA